LLRFKKSNSTIGGSDFSSIFDSTGSLFSSSW
jgi:hypothetical protein